MPRRQGMGGGFTQLPRGKLGRVCPVCDAPIGHHCRRKNYNREGATTWRHLKHPHKER